MAQIELVVDRPTNPGQLEGEIRAIPGFPQTGLSVYRTTGRKALVIYSGALSQALRQAALSVINAHVPDFTQEDEDAEFQELIPQVKAAYLQFDSLTDEQRWIVVKRMLRVLGLLLRQ